MNDQPTNNGWDHLRGIIEDLTDAKLLGLILTAFLIYAGLLPPEDWRWVFGFYVGGSVVGGLGKTYERATKYRTYASYIQPLRDAANAESSQRSRPPASKGDHGAGFPFAQQ